MEKEMKGNQKRKNDIRRVAQFDSPGTTNDYDLLY